MAKKRKKRVSARVRKVLTTPGEPEKAQIDIDEAEELYKEIRVENTLPCGCE